MISQKKIFRGKRFFLKLWKCEVLLVTIVFTLLHYNNKQITKEAVSYLQKLDGISRCEIIIVDNASPNGSGKELQDEYECVTNIHVMLNPENGGFAYGNNRGYQYARELNGDIIVVMNSDIYIKDKRFIENLRYAAEHTNAEIIAPNIIGRHGAQNPFRLKRLQTKRLLIMLCYNTFVHGIYHIPGINILLANYLDNKTKRKTVNNRNTDSGTFCIPHGACVIYLPKWTRKENIAFCPSTFMYFEEDILAEYMWKKGYQAVFDKQLTVYHVEDASVEYDNKSSVKRRKFISKCMKNSIRVLLKMRNNLR